MLNRNSSITSVLPAETAVRSGLEKDAPLFSNRARYRVGDERGRWGAVPQRGDFKGAAVSARCGWDCGGDGESLAGVSSDAGAARCSALREYRTELGSGRQLLGYQDIFL